MNKLFVYGSLRSEVDHRMGVFLSDHAELIDKGYFYGFLKNLISYPAAIEDVQKKSKVWGEMYEWDEKNANILLPALDLYEGYATYNEEDSEFLRRIVSVYGHKMEYLSYIYVHHPMLWDHTGEIITSGDYVDYLKSRKM